MSGFIAHHAPNLLCERLICYVINSNVLHFHPSPCHFQILILFYRCRPKTLHLHLLLQMLQAKVRILMSERETGI